MRALRPLLPSILPAILDELYDHVAKHPEMSAIVEASAGIEVLKTAQMNHWDALFAADFDAQFVARTTAVGDAHVRVGLGPNWFLLAYGFIAGRLAEELSKLGKLKGPALGTRFGATIRALFLDLGLGVDVYLSRLDERRAATLENAAQQLESSVGSAVEAVAAKMQELESATVSMNASMEAVDGRTSTAAMASEESTGQMQNVAAAAEELSAAEAEISSTIVRTSGMMKDAVSQSDQARETLHQLSAATDKIKSVSELIASIADQTNLLALNATIEAARADEAGKGFAVVASEVKALAGQTARATDDIAAQISAVSAAAEAVVTAMSKVSDVIKETEAAVTGITAAVEEQTAATSEISRAVSDSVERTSAVTDDLGVVANEARDTRSLAEALARLTGETSEQLRGLQSSVGEVLGSLRASA